MPPLADPDAIRDADPTRRRLGWAALFATLYFGAHQLLDFYPNMPSILAAYVIPIAWLDATAERSVLAVLGCRGRRWLGAVANPPRIAVRAGAVLAVAAIAVSAVWLGRSESVALQMESGNALANAGVWAEALPYFKAAAASDPTCRPTS